MEMKILLNKMLALGLLILFSCNPAPQESDRTAEVEAVPADTQAPPKREAKYLSQQELTAYLRSAHAVVRNTAYTTPFDTIAFNKVITYDYEGHGVVYPSVINRESGRYVPVVLRQQALNTDQVNFLVKFLTDNATYGAHTAACFIPHLGIVFYQDEAVKYVIDICLDCNYLTSTTEIPATQYHRETFDDGYSYGLRGFSENGQQKIIEISRQLGLEYGKAKFQSKFQSKSESEFE